MTLDLSAARRIEEYRSLLSAKAQPDPASGLDAEAETS